MKTYSPMTSHRIVGEFKARNVGIYDTGMTLTAGRGNCLLTDVIENGPVEGLLARDNVYTLLKRKENGATVEDDINGLRVIYPYEFSSPSIYDQTYILTDFLVYYYNTDKEVFRTFFNFCLNKGLSGLRSKEDHYNKILEDIRILGYDYDGELLRPISGTPIITERVISLIEKELNNINPSLLEVRKGAIETLISNKPDKSRAVAAACRALINNLMRDLVPKEMEKRTVKEKLTLLLPQLEKESDLIENLTKTIQTLNEIQAKGDHSFIRDETAIFIFEITERMIYFILTHRKIK